MNFDPIRHKLIADVSIPHDSMGRIDVKAQDGYVAWMAKQPIQGVAIWGRAGRGLKLDDRGRTSSFRSWREGLGANQILIAAAGSTSEDRRPDRVMASALLMARSAAEQGADALLVWPPTSFRGHRYAESLILEYHSVIAEVELPLIVDMLYESAGGISYSPQILAQLMSRPETMGIKITTLNNVITYQQSVKLVRQVAPTKLIFSGEDRFLAYSLMCEADAAIVGLAGACPSLVADFLASFWSGDSHRFLTLNSHIDDLAQHTFLSPMEGSTGRILWCLVHQGIIPAEAAYDPWGARLGSREFSEIGDCLTRIGLTISRNQVS